MARDALSRGDPAAALSVLGPASSDRDTETAALRAAALQRLGRHVEAADAYRGLTRGDPAEPGHWVGLAISLEGQRKREEARIAYRRALQSSQLAPSLRAFAQTRATALEAP
jgi:Flp pilus assembly protein TadD